jgi:tRNA dimethylallyltransferase
MINEKNSIIFIIGPTATGKTEAAYLLARHLGAEVVSSDSMLIYKEPRIITSKPSDNILEEVPHHFVNIISVQDSYSVFDYYCQALEKIKKLFDAGKPVIVCGGSGLYIKAILDGIFEGVGKDEDLRKALEEKAQKHGNQYLFDELKEVDEDSAKKISPNDLKRIIRALEVYYSSGTPISKKKQEAKGIFGKLPVRIFGLTLPRDLLYDRINRRVDEMFDAGAVEEVKSLLKLNLSGTAEKIIGVKEIEGFLKNKCDEKEARENMKRNTRRFAKRQITWFKRDKRIEWVDIDNRTPEEVKDMIKRVISK